MALFKSAGGVQWLLVCLGNPGKDYENTRHNIGFMAADELEKRENTKFNKLRYRALTGEVTIAGQRVLVISDDVSLPLGKLRIRAGGSAGGHNGLKNIIQHLGTDQFPRIKVGVGAPQHPEHEMVNWVIGNFTPAEKKVVGEAVGKALDAVECLIGKGVQEAQNKFN